MTFLLISIFVGNGPGFSFFPVLSLTLSCRLRNTEKKSGSQGGAENLWLKAEKSLTSSGNSFPAEEQLFTFHFNWFSA